MTLFSGSSYLYLVIATVDIICFITGTSSSWSSPIIAKLQTDDSRNPLNRKITSEEVSWIGSLAAIGGIFGPFIFCFLVERTGRKMTLALISLPFLVAYMISAFAKTVELFYVARVLMGIGVGGMFCVCPIYIVEVAENSNRGLLQATTTTCLVMGILFTYCVGPYVSVMTFNLILSGICLLFIPALWFIAPETPYFLASKNKHQEALKSLRSIRRSSITETQKEYDGIKAHVEQLRLGSYSDIFRTKATTKAFLYSIVLTTIQQFSGMTVILYFTENIFDATGSDISPEVSSIVVGAAQLVVSMISPPFLDRVGKKPLLMMSLGGAMIAEIVLGVYFFLQENGNDVSDLGWLPVCSLVVFIAFYNFGMGAIPWAVMGEILPLDIIAKAAVSVTSFYWLVGFFLTNYFGALSDGIGMAGSFWMFAGFCVLFEVFIFLFMFETKGKSLIEIQEILSS